MRKKHNNFVVFLDVDGVLNSKTTVQRTPTGYTGIDDCEFDFRDYRKLWERLLLTNGVENAQFAAKTPAVETMIFMDYLKLF